MLTSFAASAHAEAKARLSKLDKSSIEHAELEQIVTACEAAKAIRDALVDNPLTSNVSTLNDNLQILDNAVQEELPFKPCFLICKK